MAKIELEYIEIDGLLYPNIETGMENIDADLGSTVFCVCGIYVRSSRKCTVNCFWPASRPSTVPRWNKLPLKRQKKSILNIF